MIYAGRKMAAVLTYDSQPPPSSLSFNSSAVHLTLGHELSQITLDANELANYSAYAPGIWGSAWRSVSFIHGLVAGLYIGYGWIHTIEACSFKNNAVVNLYLDRAVNSVNVLNNNFAAGPGLGLLINSGEAVRVVGNCFQSLAGPAIYANQVGALTISGSYYEANNLNTSAFTFGTSASDSTLCADVILNGAGNKTGGHWSELEWESNPARLEALVVAGDARLPYGMRPQPLASTTARGSAIIEGNYFNPDQSHCKSHQYFAVYVAGGDGIAVRNNDCRACAKRHATRRCSAVGGLNVSGVLTSQNTGDFM